MTSLRSGFTHLTKPSLRKIRISGIKIPKLRSSHAKKIRTGLKKIKM